MAKEKTIDFNYGFLKDKITQVCGTQAAFAARLGVSKQTLSNKLNNKNTFSHEEIYKTSTILDLSESEIMRCFFIPRELKKFTPKHEE